MRTAFICLFAGLFTVFVFANNNAGKEIPPIRVILDTDMGNDIDDAMALDMLYKYMDEGRLSLLGIILNKDCSYSPEFVDIMNTWYGYPAIPIGIFKEGDSLNADGDNYAKTVSELLWDGKPMFKRTIKDYNLLPQSVKLYRKLLSEQPDESVTIISIGFLTNLAQLLESGPDEFSPLNGKELIKAKVTLLSVMAGCFSEKPHAEYNVIMDLKAAQQVFMQWPVPTVISPFELGNTIRYPGANIESGFEWASKHPLVEAYKAYSPNETRDRSTWDLTSVLYAMEPAGGYFNKSPQGSVYIDEDGISRFVENEHGNHCYLMVNADQQIKILNYFTEIIARKLFKYT